MLRLILVCFLIPAFALTQTPPDDLEGESLRSWLKSNTYNGKYEEMSYRSARRAMYNFIDNRDDKVEGVYGGYLKDVPFGGSNSNPAPINCEHTVPQSFFNKSQPMRSDIHHLFPTFDRFNSRRSNFPFEEIPDNETDKWLIDRSDRDSIPSENIDDYSESANRRFEPREAQKGNTARAVFYFYTMYPNFDMGRVGDINMFYAWHLADPVDEIERERNKRVEEQQGNRNPYIDHPELAVRAYNIDLNKVRDILRDMGKDPDLVSGSNNNGGPGDGGGVVTNSNDATIQALEAVASKLETALEDVRNEIQRLKSDQ